MNQKHTQTHICTHAYKYTYMHTHTYAITISENEARKLKESKKRDMETFIDRNKKGEMLQFYYNIKNNKGL